MLTITPDAMKVIRRVTAHPALEPTSGLRIAQREKPSTPLEVRAVRRPCPGDSVLERPGARLFLEPSASARVNGQVLDAVTESGGRVQFILRDAA